MPRLRLIITVGVLGLLLAALHHACSSTPGRPPTAAPAELSETHAEQRRTAALPVPAGDLGAAEQTVREFMALYPGRGTDLGADSSLTRLYALATTAYAAELAKSATWGDAAAVGGSQERSETAAATVITRLKIRYLAATSIQYETTTRPPPNDSNYDTDEGSVYAITVVRQDDAWKVDGVQPADAGNGGVTPP